MEKKIFMLAVALTAFIPFSAHASENEDEAFLDTTYKTVQDVLLPRAKWKRSDIASVPKFGGYVIGSYKYDNRAEENGGDGFGLRLVRVYVDGSIMNDFKYRLQVELNASPHIKDAFLTWSHWKELEVKVGQFKRCFTFENPYNPWDVGVGDYSQLAKKLSGFGDRVGETSMGGRDLGLQVQGDLFKSRRDGHYQLHYTLGIFNGQGINRKDANKRKDVIGNLQWMPIKGLWLGAFGWRGNWVSPEGLTLERNRYSFSVKYENPDNNWSARAEYARSHGHKASDYVAATEEQPAYWKGGSKADAWYVTVGVPVWRWIKCYAKYDVYRDYATKASMHTIYSFSTNLQPHKNLMLQLQYNYHNDKSRTNQNYHQFWVQTYFRF